MAQRAPALKRAHRETDERLLIEAAQRDAHAFASLYEQYFERVYAFVARRLGDRDAAEDVTADVFHHALASIGRFEWRGVPFSAWLFRIAANRIADHAGRARRLARDGESGAEDPAAPDLEEIEERARLFRLVGELPVDQRSVVAMRFAERRSIRDIAQAMQRSEGAIKQLQFRALANLRARLRKHDE
jgi:RNA polymerase sigma-70 factor (ECF subfamily)